MCLVDFVVSVVLFSSLSRGCVDDRYFYRSTRKFIFHGDQRAVQEARSFVDDIVVVVVVVVVAFVFVVVFASGARPGLRVSQRHLLEIERPNNLPRITSDASLPLSLSLSLSLSFSLFPSSSLFELHRFF